MKKIVTALLVAGGLLALSGCKNLSEQEKDTAIGAELGAISGAILTDGSGLGTVVVLPSAGLSATRPVSDKGVRNGRLISLSAACQFDFKAFLFQQLLQ